MTPRLAVVIIASDKRRETTFPRVIESCLGEYVNQLVVVADFPWPGGSDWRHFCVPPITRTTIDALIKRDVGLAVTDTEYVMYLSDDHILEPGFVRKFEDDYMPLRWDILVPSRFCIRDGEKTWLNMGRDQGYCGGHAGIYKRRSLQYQPWVTTEHHPNWDLIQTHQMVASGANLRYAWPDLAIEDIEGGTPWL